MKNRFSHLKKTTSTSSQSLEDFIDGANKTEGIHKAKKRISRENVLLSISGRMDREEDCHKKPILLYMKKDVANDIGKYCHGNKQAIVNYLVRKGLDELIQNKELVLVME